MPQYIYRLAELHAGSVPIADYTPGDGVLRAAKKPVNSRGYTLGDRCLGGFPGTANYPTFGRTRLQRFRCAIGVSLFERFLLRGRRQVAGEIRREFDFAHISHKAVFGNVRALPDQYSLNERRPWNRHRLRLSNCLPRRLCVPQSSAACSSLSPLAIPERQPN